ncbi:hypothetical protein FKM82_003276 [Ascaphus truei]
MPLSGFHYLLYYIIIINTFNTGIFIHVKFYRSINFNQSILDNSDFINWDLRNWGMRLGRGEDGCMLLHSIRNVISWLPLLDFVATFVGLSEGLL